MRKSGELTRLKQQVVYKNESQVIDVSRSGAVILILARCCRRRALPQPGGSDAEPPMRPTLPSLANQYKPASKAEVVHHLATEVVPSPWQQPSAGGPMLIANDTRLSPT
jgi:hypothetical protein